MTLQVVGSNDKPGAAGVEQYNDELALDLYLKRGRAWLTPVHNGQISYAGRQKNHFLIILNVGQGNFDLGFRHLPVSLR